MRSRVDARFVEERGRYRLLHVCEDCVHFDAVRDRCAHGFPTADHRSARAATVAPGGEVVFCKEWEIR